MNKLPLTLGILAIATGVLAWWPANLGGNLSGATAEKVLGKTTADGKLVPIEQVAGVAVVEWDETAAIAKRIIVNKSGDGWAITSHYGYPADAQDRASKLAATFLGAELGREVTSDTAKHADLGVLDPDDQDAAKKTGRGKRLTLKDASDGVLVDVIVGKTVDKGQGLVYVREVGSNAVYTTKLDAWQLTTRFTDYVETNPFEIMKEDIRQTAVSNYQLDIAKQALIQKEPEIVLSKPLGAEAWDSAQAPAEKRVANSAVESLLSDITGLRLTGVRDFGVDKKDLQSVYHTLGAYGFYGFNDPQLMTDPRAVIYNLGNNKLAMLGNEGRTDVLTRTGLRFSFMFGTICADPEFDAPKAPLAEGATKAEPVGSNRYMTVFVQYVPDADEVAKEEAAKAAASGTAATPKKKTVQSGKDKAAKLQERFQRFFYVISDSSFRNLRPTGDKLFEAKPAEPMAGTTGKTNVQWLDENGKREGVTTTPSGLQYEVLTAGPTEGTSPGPQASVEVKYKGSLVDGTEFDSSKDATTSFTVGGVIKGWGEALQLMKPGDQWKLYVPPALGYAETGSPPKIGPSQILIFEVELVKVATP